MAQASTTANRPKNKVRVDVTRAEVSEIKIVDTDLVLTLKDGRKLYVSDGAIQSVMDPEFAVEFADGDSIGGQELLQTAGAADVTRIGVTSAQGGEGEGVIAQAPPAVVPATPAPAPAPAKNGGLKSWLAIGTPLVGGLLGGVMGGGGGAAAGATGSTGDGTTAATKTATPVILAVTADDKVNGAEKTAGVTVNGLAEPNATVTINWGATTKTATASASGAWSATFAAAELPSDATATTLTASAKTSTGTTSDFATRTVQIDTSGPGAPTIAAIAGDNVVGPTERTGGVTVTGTAEPGSAVTITWGSTTKTVAVDAVGNWTANFAASEVPPAGSYTISASATDSLGNIGTAGTRAISVTPAVTIEGVITAGPVLPGNGLSVEIYTGAGTLVASGIPVSATGTFSAANLPLTPGDIVVVRVVDQSTSADYQDEATNAPKDLNAPLFATAVVAGATMTVNVNPLTTIAGAKAGLAIDGTGVITSSSAITNAQAATAQAFGLTGVDLVRITPAPTNGGQYNPDDGVSDSERVGAVLAALSGVDAQNGGNAQTTIVAMVQNLTVTGTSGALSEAAAASLVAGAVAADASAPGALSSIVSDVLAGATGTGQVSIAPVTPDNIVTASETTGLRLTGTLPTGATALSVQIGAAQFTAAIDGSSWSYDLTSADVAQLGADGAKIVKATATLANATTVSAMRPIMLAATRPTTPTIAAIATDGVVNAAERNAGISITGTATPGSLVEVALNGVKKTAVVGADSSWTVDIARTELPTSGTLNVTATATDSFGNVSDAASRPVSIVTTTPGAPVIAAVAGDDLVGPIEKSGNVTISGTAVEGGKVTLTWGAITRTVQVDASGAWSTSFTPSQVPDDGEYEIQAVASDSAGNPSLASVRLVRVDATPPAQPLISNVATDNVVNWAEKQLGVTVRGTSEANASIEVTWAGVTRTARASATGSWSVNFSQSQVPNDGPYTITATAQDSAFNTSSAASRQVTVDSSTQTPVITAVGTGTVITAADKANGVAVRGTAEAGSSVQVTFGTATRQVTTANNGTWEVLFGDTDVPNATSVAVTARSTDSALNQSLLASRTVPVDVVAPAAPVISPVSVDDLVGTADFVTPLRISGTAEANADVSVVWGQVTKQAKADASGAWFVTFANSERPPSGNIDVIARASDAAGNLSDETRRPITVDYDGSAPVIADVTGDNLIGTSEREAGVAVTGSATPGSTVTVTWNGVPKTATADASGAWTVDYATAQIPTSGTSNVTARATTPAGNVSTLATKPVTVDLTAEAPTIDPVSVDNLLGNADLASSVRVSGTAEPGSTVVVGWGSASSTATADNSGAWLAFFDPATLPPNGESTITVRATDLAGNLSGTVPRVVTIDRVAPTAPTIAVVSGGTVNGAEKTAGVAVSGTAEPGATVTVSWGGGSPRDVIADASGAWQTTFNASAITSEGVINVTAFQKDAAGNIGPTESRQVTVDTLPPEPPTIDDVTGNNIINTSEKTAGVPITGKALANAPVTVTWGGVTLATTADANGDWDVRFEPGQVPADGPSSITATQRDPAGNVSLNSPPKSVIVDTGSATAATILPVSGDNRINDSERTAGVTITGTAPANGRVEINWNGITRSVNARADGTWETTFAAVDIPTSGTSTITATPFNAAGNSGTAGTQTVTIDTTPPPAPVINTVANDNRVNQNEKNAGVTISGTGEAGGKVFVTWGATPTREADIDASGNWSLLYDKDQVPGDGVVSVSVTQRDPAGNPSTSAAVQAVTIDTNLPSAPTFSANAIAGDNVVSLAEKNSPGGITISGAGAEAGATVTVTWGTSSKSTGTLLTGGAWSVTFGTADIPGDGTPAIQVTQRDAAGNGSNLRTRTGTVTIDTNGPDAPLITNISAGPIINNAERQAGVTISGTTEANATVAVTWGAVTKTVTATASGAWQAQFGNLEIPGDGPSTIVATATDAIGNVGATSNPTNVTIDLVAPGQPVIATVAGDNIVSRAEKSAGVIVSGTAEANASVAITWGTKTEVATANSSGVWSTTFQSADVPADTNTSVISASATDAAGNTGIAGTRTVAIDTTPPAPPVIAGIVGQYSATAFTTDQNKVRVAGTGEAGSTVSLFVGGTQIGTAIVDAKGVWVSPDLAISGSSLVITARQTDSLGNVSSPTLAQTITKTTVGGATDVLLSSLTTGAGLTIYGDLTGDALLASGAGDFNGDGLVDIVVGADGGDDGGSDAGEAYVLFGKAQGQIGKAVAAKYVVDLTTFTPSDGFILQGYRASGGAGASVASAGDLNGDGIADIVVGAPAASAVVNGVTRTGAGEAYVVFGKSGAFGALVGGRSVLDLAALAPGDGFVLAGEAANAGAGFSVASAGDVNGDGRADLIIGSRTAAEGGKAFVLFGKSSSTFGTLSGGRNIVDLATLPASEGFYIQGDQTGDNLGHTVTSAGDVNGDGIADLLVSAPLADDGSVLNSGKAYVVFGRAGGGWGGTDGSGRRVLDVTALGSQDGLVIKGAAAQDNTGFGIAGVGDINGDGVGDFVVGANSYDEAGRTLSGAAWVIFGKSGTSTGAARVIDLANLASSDGFMVVPQNENDQLGISAAGAGDVNGDGIADILLSASRFERNWTSTSQGWNEGRTYVIFGKAGGGWATTTVGGRDMLNLSSLSSADGVTITGTNSGDQTGGAIQAGGDLNGDGVNDILIGGTGVDKTAANSGGTPQNNVGGVFAVFGQSTWGGLSRTGTATSDFLIGGDMNDTFSAVGTGDVALGFGGNDAFIVTSSTFNRIDGGSGTDTISLSGGGLGLDLTALPAGTITGIERIDIRGVGTTGNTLTITRETLKALSDTSDTLIVNMDANDTVNASGFTTSGATQTINGVTYTVYTNGDATLLVQAGGTVVTPPDAIGAASFVLDPYSHGQMVL